MNRAPLVYIVIALIIGISTARYIDTPFFLLWIPSLLAAVISSVFLKSDKIFTVFLLLSVVFFGGASFRNSALIPPDHIANFVTERSRKVVLEGVIESDPSVKGRVKTFVLKTEKLVDAEEVSSVCGRVLVKLFTKGTFSYGDKIFLEGNIYRVPYFRISGRFTLRDYLVNRGIYAILSVKEPSAARLLDRDKGSFLKGMAFGMRRRTRDLINKNMPPFSGAMLNAILLGERSGLSADLKKVMAQTGTIHIIAISGLHIGLISLIILMALKILRLPRKFSYVVAALILVVYCVATGARPSVVRATIMALILFFRYILGRQTNIYNSLSAAALLILLNNPKQVFNIGFQLSFISVISIAGFSPKIKSLFAKELFKRQSARILISLFCASLSVWIGLFALTAYYFNIVSNISLLANIIIVPYLSLIVGSGILAVMAGFLCPPAADIFFAANETFIALLVKFISSLAKLPGAYLNIANVSFHSVIVYYVFLSISLLILSREAG